MANTDQFLEKLKTKKHIIWDWNGTILNDIQYAVKTISGLLQEHQLSPISIEKYRELFCFPIKSYYDKLGFTYEKVSFEQLCHQFVERFMTNISSCSPFAEVLTVIKHLHQHGHTQSVLSATDQENLNIMISHYELGQYFNNVYGLSDKLAASKIERGKELMKVSNIDPKQTIMIGDTLHDLEVGQGLGIDVALITHGHQSTDRLKAKYDGVYSIAKAF